MAFKFKIKDKRRRSAVKFATGFTLLIIPNSTDEARTTEISYDRLVKYIAAFAAVVIIIIGFVISLGVHNYRLKQKLGDTKEQVETLESSNSELESKVEALNRQIETDREAFSKIEDTISLKEEEENQEKEEAAIPSSIPIKGKNALVVSDPYEGNDKMQSYGMVISSFKGALIVTTGDGIIDDVQHVDVPEGYDSMVCVDHQNGYRTYYRFVGEISVKTGDAVLREDVLGVLSDDGFLSYEISLNEKFIDPKEVIKQ